MFSKGGYCFIGVLLLASISPLVAVKVPIVVDGLFEDWSNTGANRHRPSWRCII